MCARPVVVASAETCARCGAKYHGDCKTYNVSCAIFGCEPLRAPSDAKKEGATARPPDVPILWQLARVPGGILPLAFIGAFTFVVSPFLRLGGSGSTSPRQPPANSQVTAIRTDNAELAFVREKSSATPATMTTPDPDRWYSIYVARESIPKGMILRGANLNRLEKRQVPGKYLSTMDAIDGNWEMTGYVAFDDVHGGTLLVSSQFLAVDAFCSSSCPRNGKCHHLPRTIQDVLRDQNASKATIGRITRR